MSGGGGQPSRQTQVSEPWGGVQPYLRGLYGRASTLSARQPEYFPGATTVGPTEAENSAWSSRLGYNNAVFGNQPQLQYGDATGALSRAMNGGYGMASAITPQATHLLTTQFQGPNTSGISGIQVPQQSRAAGNIGNYGFGTSLDASGRSPTFGVAGNLDARGAYQRMLSGQPDYQGTQAAIEAANAPILRQLNEQIIPELNQRATFSNNPTGGIKGLNRVLPEIGERMALNAQNINNQERLRALEQQERAANAISSGGFQGYGLGLQTAQGERGLEQSLAGLGLQADTTRGQMQLSDYDANLSGSQFGLQREGMIQDANDRYRADLLNYGSLAGQLGSQQTGQSLQAAGLFPSLYQAGRAGGDDALAYANYDRALREDSLASEMDRFNYLRDAPYDRLSWYNSILAGAPGGTTTTTANQPRGSRAAGALGGALSGAAVGSALGPWGSLIGGGIGLLGGLF